MYVYAFFLEGFELHFDENGIVVLMEAFDEFLVLRGKLCRIQIGVLLAQFFLLFYVSQ